MTSTVEPLLDGRGAVGRGRVTVARASCVRVQSCSRRSTTTRPSAALTGGSPWFWTAAWKPRITAPMPGYVPMRRVATRQLVRTVLATSWAAWSMLSAALVSMLGSRRGRWRSSVMVFRSMWSVAFVPRSVSAFR